MVVEVFFGTDKREHGKVLGMSDDRVDKASIGCSARFSMHGTLAYVDDFGGSPTRAELRCYNILPYHIMLFVMSWPRRLPH